MAMRKNRPRSLNAPTSTFNFVIPTASLEEIKRRAKRDDCTPGMWVREAVQARLNTSGSDILETVLDAIRTSPKLSLRYPDGSTQGDTVADEIMEKINEQSSI